MYKRLVIAFGALFVLFGAFYVYSKTAVNTGNLVNRIATKLFDFNELEIEASENIDVDDIMLQHNDNVVFSEGRRDGRIRSVYGMNTFEVFYKSRPMYKFRFFKKNNWHTNNYHFSVRVTDSFPECAMKIVGPDSNANVYFEELSR